MPTENVLVRNRPLTSDWGAFKLGTESMGDFKNIRFVDSVIQDTPWGGVPSRFYRWTGADWKI